jgi:hypothetical protein
VPDRVRGRLHGRECGDAYGLVLDLDNLLDEVGLARRDLLEAAISTKCRTSSRVYVSPSNLLWLLLVVALVVLLVGLFTGRQAV